ncbi:isocitrate/isopropylmalate family dehydrogenase [Acuticoccus sp.]|uniref:isocitrate/isopropylmalate family dehydrogenase n=1 Tax=Acuticoccus sp. TaxID=1904378 RepID=UPI003B529FFE
MSVTLAVMEGDGIGPDVVAATLTVLRAADERHRLGLAFDAVPVGRAAIEAQGSSWPEGTEARIAAADGVILGPVDGYAYPAGQPSPSGKTRQTLDLFANIRPARPRLPEAARAFDLVIYRENTEGFYAARFMAAGTGEFAPTPDVALAVRKITRAASLRIARAAFAAAERRRGRVTAVHKANVLSLTDGLFLRSVREVAAEHPRVELDEVIVDAMAALLVRDPARFDVVVTTNMFGDILSDLAGELAGGLGLAPGLNASESHAVAQAVHGAAPDIAGRGIANPAALILSAALLLAWLGERRGDGALGEAAHAVEAAVTDALADPMVRTPDVGGLGTTQGFAEAVARRVAG